MIDVTSDSLRVTDLPFPATFKKLTHTSETTKPMTYNSSFQDRAAQAAAAKQKALEQLRTRPPLDEQAAAERLAAGQQRAAAKAEKAAAKKAERAEAASAATADAAAKAAAAIPKTEAELKAARDARYAKRKGRK